MISGSVGVAVIVASCPPSQHPGAFDRSGDGEVRLTVVVGIMIGIAIGLAASGRWGVVSAVVAVSLRFHRVKPQRPTRIDVRL